MQVTCPQCSSRYKLPDEKIKSQGTKVRCPRCQHAFYVHPDGVKNEKAPATIQAKPVISKPLESFLESKTSSSISDDFSSPDDPFVSDRTVVSEIPPRVAAAIKPPPPEDDKNEVQVDDKADATSISAMDHQPSRPFGDATMAQIQVQVKRDRKISLKTLTIAILILILGGLVWHLQNKRRLPPPPPLEARRIERSPPVEDSRTPDLSQNQDTVLSPAIARPRNWHRDDPSIFQDFLNQMASLPPAEQNSPERRALVSEALIINGILTGNNDQVVTGLSYASSLLAAYPESAYGFGGLSLFAIFQEDITTLENLLSRWPEESSESFDKRLARMIVLGRKSLDTNAGREAMKQGQQLLEEAPDSMRALAWFLLFAVENPELRDLAIVGTKDFPSLVKQFEKYSATFKASQIPLPEIYKDLERKLNRKGLVGKAGDKTIKPKATSSTIEANTAKPKASPSPSVATVKPISNKLPKPNPELLAMNKKETASQKRAQELLKLGQQKLNENRIDEALQDFQNVIKENPGLADPYKHMGVIYMGRQQRDRALKNLKLYLQLKPDSDDRQLVLGWIESMQ